MIRSWENVNENPAYIQCSDLYFALPEAWLYDRTTIARVHQILQAPAIVETRYFLDTLSWAYHLGSLIIVDW
jgi:hypothetical protein